MQAAGQRGGRLQCERELALPHVEPRQRRGAQARQRTQHAFGPSGRSLRPPHRAERRAEHGVGTLDLSL